MEIVLDFVKKSGVADLFVFACIAFWCAKFVMGQDWHKEEANNLRIAISMAFYAFGVVLLFACVVTLPQCTPQARYGQNQNVSKVEPTPTVTESKVESSKQDQK